MRDIFHAVRSGMNLHTPPPRHPALAQKIVIMAVIDLRPP